MAKAILSDDGRDEALDQEAMVLMIPGYLWNVLVRQAKAEGSNPGVVFSKALTNYLQEHGSPDAVEYLWSLTR